MTSTIRVLAAPLCAASAGYADLVVYTSEAAWLSALTGAPGVENLETQSDDFLFGNGVYTFETSSGGSGMSFTSNVDNDNVVEAIMDDSPCRDGLGGNATTMLSLRGIENGEALSITLPVASSAFGFDYDNYDFGGDTL